MKKLLYLLLISVALTGIAGCEDFEKSMKHAQSSWGGLNRAITLYSADGKIIRQWNVVAKVEVDGGCISFIDNTGKEIKLSGTITVIEK